MMVDVRWDVLEARECLAGASAAVSMRIYEQAFGTMNQGQGHRRAAERKGLVLVPCVCVLLPRRLACLVSPRGRQVGLDRGQDGLRWCAVGVCRTRGNAVERVCTHGKYILGRAKQAGETGVLGLLCLCLESKTPENGIACTPEPHTHKGRGTISPCVVCGGHANHLDYALLLLFGLAGAAGARKGRGGGGGANARQKKHNRRKPPPPLLALPTHAFDAPTWW